MSTNRSQRSADTVKSTGRTHHTAWARSETARKTAASDLESRKSEALKSIWQGFSKHRSSTREPPESGPSTKSSYVNQARGFRLLIEEIQHDSEVSAALKTDLAASLRTVGATDSQQPLGNADKDRVGETALVYIGSRRMSPKDWTKSATFRLPVTRLSVSKQLLEAERIIRDLEVEQLRAAVAFSLANPDEVGTNRAIANRCVDIAGTLGELADMVRSMRDLFGPAHEPAGNGGISGELAESLRDLAQKTRRCTRRLRGDLRRLLEVRLAAQQQKPAFGSIVGGMLDLGTREQNIRFDPMAETAFRSVGDLIALPILGGLLTTDERGSATRAPSS